jgi:hypothetical protein
LLVYATFQRCSGLYFTSIVVSIIGILLYTTGYILSKFENNAPLILVLCISISGWVLNLTGFSLVLWSRLHLVVNHSRTLKAVLAMIIINSLCCHTTTIVLTFRLVPKHSARDVHMMKVMESIEQVVFATQETIISSLYIYHTARFLRSGYAIHTRKVIGMLLCIQILVVAFDVIVTVLLFTDRLTLGAVLHPFFNSIKLKSEFLVLNQLQTLVREGSEPGLNLEPNLPVDPPGLRRAQLPWKQHSVLPSKQNFSTTSSTVLASACTIGKNSDSMNNLWRREGKRKAFGNQGSDQIGRCKDQDVTNIIENHSCEKDGIDDLETQYLGRWAGK